MAEDNANEKKDTNGQEDQSPTNLPQTATTTDVLSGADKLLDGDTHTGIAVLVSSDGSPSTLMIPDVTRISEGQPVYITKPIRIDGVHLKTFLEKKNIKLPTAVANLIEDTKISCEAFYWTKDGPLLLMFALKFDKGLIGTLTGDEDLGNLFDIQGAAVRVLRCPKGSYEVLQKYAAGLAA
jgi:hypothetical protein